MAWSDFTQTTVIPLAGDNIANATPGGDATGDLVSAAANVNGITITALSLNLSIRQNSGGPDGLLYLQLLINGLVHSELAQRRIVNSASVRDSASGGICAIEVPAGQAVSYAANKGGTTADYYGYIRIAWRHKA